MSGFRPPSGRNLVARPDAGGRIERTGPFQLGRPGQDNMIIIAPLDQQVAAWQGDRGLARRTARAGAVDDGGAGGGAAGLGEASAALPGAQDDAVWRKYLSDRDICLPG